VAEVFTAFIGPATQQLDIAIYDFRLIDGPLTDQIVGAVEAAAGREVSVRLAYDRVQGAADDVTLKAFADAGDAGSTKVNGTQSGTPSPPAKEYPPRMTSPG
jgi:hypothetical protein